MRTPLEALIYTLTLCASPAALMLLGSFSVFCSQPSVTFVQMTQVRGADRAAWELTRVKQLCPYHGPSLPVTPKLLTHLMDVWVLASAPGRRHRALCCGHGALAGHVRPGEDSLGQLGSGNSCRVLPR